MFLKLVHLLAVIRKIAIAFSSLRILYICIQFFFSDRYFNHLPRITALRASLYRFVHHQNEKLLIPGLYSLIGRHVEYWQCVFLDSMHGAPIV